MAESYAPEYWNGAFAWWSEHYIEYVIAEKKRFLTDLIQKVKEMTDVEWNSILEILKEE